MSQPTEQPAIHLRIATPAEQVQRWRVHHATWGDGFELPLYLRREEALRGHADIGPTLVMWLACDAGGRVLASCETYATAAWSVDAGGALQAERMQTIASVVVEPALRGNGYATALMTAVVEAVRAEGNTVTALYSDVGPQLYRRSGHMLHPARESWRTVDASDSWPTGVTELGIGDVADLLQMDRDQQTAWLGGSSAPAIVEAARVDRVAWFHVRSQYRAWARGQAPSQVVGAASGPAGWCLWTSDAHESALHVLAWRPHSADGARRLTQACLAHAAERRLREVIWWDADRDTGLDPYRRPLLQPVGVLHRARDKALPMLGWLDEARPFPLVWMGIERLGWR